MPITTAARPAPDASRSSGLGLRPAPLPAPEVLTCVAFLPARTEVKTTVGFDTFAATQRTTELVRDPFYLELAGVPVGATIEVVNLSAHPNGTFASHGFTLHPTGYRAEAPADEPPTGKRCGKRGLCSVFLGHDAMAQAAISGNSKLLVRVVDAAGRASPEQLVTVGVDASALPGAARLDDVIRTDRSVSSSSRSSAVVVGREPGAGGTRVTRDVTTTTDYVTTTKTTSYAVASWRARLLEGPGCLQEVRVSDGWDHQPTTLVAKNVGLRPQDGKLHVVLDRAVEPDAAVALENTRTGSRVEGRVDGRGHLALPLPDDVGTGDVLKLVLSDRIVRSSVANTTVHMAVVDETVPGGLRFAADPSDAAPPPPRVPLGGRKAHALALPEVGNIPAELKPGAFPYPD